MTRWLLAGAAYFAIVFVIAFALGALRVVFVAPVVGPFLATLIELPIMLCVSWVVCGALMRALALQTPDLALGMGASALALLIGAETAFSVLVFGQSISELLASYRTPHGLLGLSGQLAFGAIPLMRCFAPARAWR